MSPPRVLTIAGSDSGGGAGIQADLKAFLSLGTYGLSVLTALTAQNTTGVSGIHACPPEFAVSQFDAVTSDIEIDAVKIGMLCNEGIVTAIAQRLQQWKEQDTRLGGKDVPVVLDPVMVSTSGSLLLSEGAIETLIRDFLPLCTLLTPNLPEARQLLKYATKIAADAPQHSSSSFPSNLELLPDADTMELPQMMAAAEKLASLGPLAVLVKGGHAQLKRVSIDEWVNSLPDSVEVLEPIRPPNTANGSAYPVRPGKSRGSDTKEAVAAVSTDDTQDLQLLAGMAGAQVSRRGNVVIVRTDQLPFSQVLNYGQGSEHLGEEGEPVICDVLFERTAAPKGRFTLFIKPMVRSKATHGTGCTLSSAVAASLAQGNSLVRAVSIGIDYVQKAISCGINDLGSGPGPLDHAFPFQPRGLSLVGQDTDGKPHLHQRFPLCRSLISHSRPAWSAFVQHPFVLGLADGSLNKDAFVWFMKQDYIFLRHYARVWAQAATSLTNTLDEIQTLSGMAQTLAHEAQLHLRLCESSFGVTRHELENRTMESAATLAYTRYVMEVGRSGDLLDLLVAVAPCMLGYAEVGLWLNEQTLTKNTIDPDYKAWIDAYADKEFQDATQKSIRLIEERAQADAPSPARLAGLQKIWNAACRLEAGMWDEAINSNLRRNIVEP
ncbi:hypothetical protein BCV70DRAFT_202107 [Testicularia cyperi]|uniref:Phosphomethylpyrimidine kinase n=1 Tax=Testicularia cyperi TaxID=1882483 RepID=A0A317XLR3_9BASI|nr:hypothetical protein BCV70DRAFT_202107 [Testicularia cyperi]